jgi:lysophospholipase L1-like esterase
MTMKAAAGVFLAAAMLTAWAGDALAADAPCALAAVPRNKEYPWMSIARWTAMHAEDVAVAAKGEVDLMFLGDSITEGWPAQLFAERFGQYKAVNFGIGGDHTGTVLWRLQDPHFAALTPRLIVLLIGVNNFGLCGESAEQAFSGIAAVVAALRKQYPAARILLNALLPTDETPAGAKRAKVVAVNRMVATLHDGKQVLYRDYGPAFLQADGSLSNDVMPDFLHLSEKGYRMWSDAMQSDVNALMKP